jgi:3-oxoacyl-[acyl-carrier protein] reductase
VTLHRNAASLDGRVAVVTGGGSGIGRAVAAAFTEFGARVSIWEKEAQAATSAAEEIDGLACVTDVRDEEQVDAALAATVDSLGLLPSWLTTPAESSGPAYSKPPPTGGTR